MQSLPCLQCLFVFNDLLTPPSIMSVQPLRDVRALTTDWERISLPLGTAYGPLVEH